MWKIRKTRCLANVNPFVGGKTTFQWCAFCGRSIEQEVLASCPVLDAISVFLCHLRFMLSFAALKTGATRKPKALFEGFSWEVLSLQQMNYTPFSGVPRLVVDKARVSERSKPTQPYICDPGTLCTYVLTRTPLTIHLQTVKNVEECNVSFLKWSLTLCDKGNP